MKEPEPAGAMPERGGPAGSPWPGPSPSEPLRVLIVDDHQVVRMGLRLLEQDYSWIRVVGEAATPDEALRAGDLLRPDAVIMDVRLAGGSGIDVCRQIKERHPTMKVLMLTSFLSESLIIDAIDAGADGYLLKECEAAEIVRSLETIMRGGIAMSPKVSRASVQAHLPASQAAQARWVKELSGQEMRVLAALAEGLTNKEIAVQMDLSPMTIRNYLERVFLKMGVQRRAAAAVLYSRAKAEGLVSNHSAAS